MPKYSSELTFREEVAEGTMAFHFNRPNGFEFKPGQHIDITLLNASQTDDEGNMRTFSLAGAPFEKDLMITTRIRATAFKREITTVELPYAVQIEGPLRLS
jgi:ferredoxin-NADP reductase